MLFLKKLITNKPFTLDNDYREVIFKLYYKTAYRAAYYYCGNAQIAEEAAQETMAKVLQNIDQLKDPEKIEAWIKKIAVNATINMFNQRKKIVNIENQDLCTSWK